MVTYEELLTLGEACRSSNKQIAEAQLAVSAAEERLSEAQTVRTDALKAFYRAVDTISGVMRF